MSEAEAGSGPDKSEKKSASGVRALLALLLLGGASIAIAAFAEAIQLFIRGGRELAVSGLAGISIEAWGFDVVSLLLVILLFWALSNRIIVGCISTALFTWTVAFANALKHQAVGKSLVMSDFALIGDVWGVLGGVVSANVGKFVALGVFLLLGAASLTAAFRRSPLFPLNSKGRCALAVVLSLQLTFGMEVSFRNGTTGIFFRDESVNGFLMNFLRSSRHAFRCPEDYGREAVEDILVRNEHAESTRQTEPDLGHSPDVLVYVGESFFDTHRLGNAAFDVDPTPNFHRIIASEGVVSGHLTSPERGGTTANVEFELMTGLPMAVFQESTVPYHSEVFHSLEALPALFSRSGASHPMAVHNSYKEMFHYGEVYLRLGFQEFIDLSRLSTDSFSGSGSIRYDSMAGKDVLFEGLHPSDEPLAIALVDSIKTLGDGEKQRGFWFGLSVVSHGGFSSWPESEKTVRIVSDGLPQTSKDGLEHMANVLERADRALGFVADAVIHRERPTLMFFMGDHLPYIDEDFLRDGGFDFGPDGRRKYDVPFFVLANYPLPKIEIPDGMSVFFLPAKILQAAGVDGGPYFQFLESKLSEVTALTHHVVIFPDGREYSGPNDPALPPEDAERLKKLLDDFTMLTWDRLAGEGFSTVSGGSAASSSP